MARTLAGLLATLAMAALLGAGAALWGYEWFHRPGPAGVETTVIVERGAALGTIARQLEESGVVGNARLFHIATRVLSAGRTLKAGEYRFKANASAADVMRTMVEGLTVARRLTIAEGLSVTEALTLMAKAEGLTGEVPASAAGLPEGSLLPETYFYGWGDSRADMIERMAKAMREAVAELWAARADGLALDTPESAVILASIVEKETGVASERGRVARVFHNRLERGMALQSDPTVIYALTLGKSELGRALARADLGIDSPYNTYVVRGLPPGPIANPGRAALEAVLHPAEGNDLYFVADGTGGHAFAATLAEHNRNVAKWRKLQAP
jgi:UPF0755 protein